MGRHLLAEECLADRAVIGAVADVGQIGVDLDDIRHRAAAGLDLRLQALQGGPRLRLEIAGMSGAALGGVGDLTGDIEQRLPARNLDRLRVGRRVVDALRRIEFDLGHVIPPPVPSPFIAEPRGSDRGFCPGRRALVRARRDHRSPHDAGYRYDATVLKTPLKLVPVSDRATTAASATTAAINPYSM